MKFADAQAPLRKEDDRFLTGRGLYVDDRALAGQAWLCVVRSPYAHARLVSIDTSRAAAVPGVLAVATGRELVDQGINPIPAPLGAVGEDGQPATSPERHLLGVQCVRFVGEGVAAIVAEDALAARDAADLVAVEYEELPVVPSIGAALAPGAPRQWTEKPTNVCAVREIGERAPVDSAFACAAHVTRLTITQNRLAPTTLEPRGVLATFDPADGRVTLYGSCQNPTAARRMLAGVLGVAEEQVRVVVGDIGGGFGLKINLYPEDGLAAYFARRLGRPIKWRGERAEAFLADCHGRDQVATAAVALSHDGRITALSVDVVANAGAYLASGGVGIPLVLGPKVLSGAYAIPHLHFRGRVVLTHTAPVNAYRGAGRPENLFVIERLLDAAARETGIDPVELRKRNFVAPDAFPFAAPTGETYDCGAFSRVLDAAVRKSDWAGFGARKAGSERRGMLRGRGLAYYVEWTGADLNENVSIEARADGRIRVAAGTQNMGQGLETAYAQLVSYMLGVPYDRVDVVFGDTDVITGVGSFASRSGFIGATILKAGTDRLVAEVTDLAAEALETARADLVYAAGRVSVAGTDRSVSLAELAARAIDGRITVRTRTRPENPSWPNGCYIVEVEVDPETGDIRVDRVTGVDDVGTVVNAPIVAGQVHGGLAQGIGQALLEHAVYDTSAQLLTGSLMDYALPRAGDLPMFDIETFPGVPSPGNPLGVKGVGEIGCVGAPPAVVGAVVDALSARGAAHLDMPITREKVWRALRGTTPISDSGNSS